MRLSPSSSISEGHMDEQLGMRKFFPCQKLQWYMSVAWLETLQRNGILACGDTEITFQLKTFYRLTQTGNL